MFGRAQAMLGIVKQSKRGTGKVARAKAQKAAGKRGPGRPRKTAVTGSMDALGSIIDAVKSNEQEKARLRSVLERIQTIVNNALS